MGRIAEALKRAEEERRSTSSARSALYTPVVDRGDEGQPASRTGYIPTGPMIQEPKVQPAAAGEHDTAECKPRLDGLSESLVPFLDSTSPITEQYRSLRTRLLSQNPNHEHRVIAITSAVPKEGKSVTTLNLACVLAEIRHLRVLVVDGDFRRSSLAHMLHQPTTPGLADVLSGDAHYQQVQRSTPVSNLSFIPAGDSRRQTSAQLLTETAVQDVFQRMRRDFDYTLVDTPPATTVTDVGILGPFVCGVILVVRLHRTYEAAARRAVRLLQVNNVPILGSLIVGRDAPADSYGYAYNYRYQRYYEYIKHAASGNTVP